EPLRHGSVSCPARGVLGRTALVSDTVTRPRPRLQQLGLAGRVEAGAALPQRPGRDELLACLACPGDRVPNRFLERPEAEPGRDGLGDAHLQEVRIGTGQPQRWLAPGLDAL